MNKMLRNTILILLSTTINSSGLANKTGEENLKNLKTALENASVYMEKEAKYEDAAIVIGVTKSGKSTLVNYLIGTRLIATKSKLNSITIQKADNSSTGPEIGTGSSSKTKIPSRWISNKFSEMSIWDLPGFDDNRGAVQDITNAFYIYELLQKVKSLKIILVVSYEDIKSHDNVQHFQSALNNLENLMNNRMHNCFHGMTVIFSKVPEIDDTNNQSVDVNLIKKKLQDTFLSQKEEKSILKEVSNEFIKFLNDNPNHIGIFKRATKVGEVSSEIEVNIVSAINSSKPIPEEIVREMSPSISEKSKTFLHAAQETLSPLKAIDELQNEIKLTFDNLLMKNSVVSENTVNETFLMETKEKLVSVLLDTSSTLMETLKNLQKLDDHINKTVIQHNLIEKFALIEFFDKLLNSRSSYKLKSKLQDIIYSNISNLETAIQIIELNLEKLKQKGNFDKLNEEKYLLVSNLKKLREKLQKLQVSKKTNSFTSIVDCLGNFFCKFRDWVSKKFSR